MDWIIVSMLDIVHKECKSYIKEGAKEVTTKDVRREGDNDYLLFALSDRLVNFV